MKVSLNIANYFSSVRLDATPINDLVATIGRQLGEVEGVESWAERYKGMVVAKVVSCTKHENADKLQVCYIDDGEQVSNVDRRQDGLVEVVCGAPNVAAGQLVVWLPPGSVVPATLAKEPLTLEAREIRGVVSNGMLASEAELGLSDNHDGILVITPDEVGPELATPGTPLTRLFGLDDTVIEIENKMFTHRPDCFGTLGVARELAGIQGLPFQSPDWYLKTPHFSHQDRLELSVRVDCPELVPRFMAAAIDGVHVKHSPTWLQAALTRLGMKPINNIVDLTNFYMYVTGQPLHAYDYHKVQDLSTGAPVLIARRAENDEIALLNGKTLTLAGDCVVIATDRQAIGVGGVMGGSATEVDAHTTTVILECANFDMYNIRRTSMKYGLFTDAVTRFTKGQSPRQLDRVLARVCHEIEQLTDGKLASQVFAVGAPLDDPRDISVTSDFINARLGSDLPVDVMRQLLANVEIPVTVSDETLIVTPPFWRTDLEIAEDIVEEVGRLHGYDSLPLVLPKRPMLPAPRESRLVFKQNLRDILSRAGANEILTYSFVPEKLLQAAEQDVSLAFQLTNALSPELQYYRLSLTPSLLDKVYVNLRAGYDEFSLFELNRVHSRALPLEPDEPEVPTEANMLAFTYVAAEKVARSKSGAAYYQAMATLRDVAEALGLVLSFTAVPPDDVEAAIRPYAPTRSAYIREATSGTILGIIGEYTAHIRNALKLPVYSAGFELDVDKLERITPANRPYATLSRFPSVIQDVTFKVAPEATYGEVESALLTAVDSAANTHDYAVSIASTDIYEPSDHAAKHFTFRLTFAHAERTLTTDEVTSALDVVTTDLQTHLSAERI